MNDKLREVLNNRRSLRELVNLLCPINKFIGADSSGFFLCPFHQDNTPSAKYYDSEPVGSLYCFSCRRQFGGFDYVKDVLQQEPKDFIRREFSESDLNAAADIVFYHCQHADDQVKFRIDTIASTMLPDVGAFLFAVYGGVRV
jgi:hypothetical protein